MSDHRSLPNPLEYRPKGDNQQRSEILEDGGADIDRFFDALGEKRRRFILVSLSESGNASLDQLAEAIAEQVEGETDEEQIERIRIDLHHQHLPKLADYGLISYDDRTNMASLEPLPKAAQKILDLSQELEGEGP